MSPGVYLRSAQLPADARICTHYTQAREREERQKARGATSPQVGGSSAGGIQSKKPASMAEGASGSGATAAASKETTSAQARTGPVPGRADF